MSYFLIHRYTEWIATGFGFPLDWNRVVAEELYDHAWDPLENVNVAGFSEYQEIKHELNRILRKGWRADLRPQIYNKTLFERNEKPQLVTQKPTSIENRVFYVYGRKTGVSGIFHADTMSEGIAIFVSLIIALIVYVFKKRIGQLFCRILVYTSLT